MNRQRLRNPVRDATDRLRGSAYLITCCLMTDEGATPTETTQYYTFLDFTLDVDKALAIIAKQPDRPLRSVDVKGIARTLCLEKPMDEYLAAGQIPLLRGDVDEEYARTADLSVPVLMADMARRKGEEPVYMLIDGTHRVRRAYVDGLETLPAYLLDRAEVRRIRVR